MTRLKGVRAVLFDAGNTLIYIDPRRLREIFAAAGAQIDERTIRAAELTARRNLLDAVRDGHKGTEPDVWRGYFLTLFREAGVPEDAMAAVGERLRDRHASDHLWTHVEKGTTEALEALAGVGLRLGVISNADGRVERVLRDVGLRDHFEFVIDSDVVGVEKPDARIFLEGCARLDLEPAACLYVGDLYPVDYVGARAAGLQAVLMDPLAHHRGDARRIGALGELAAIVGD